MREGDRVRKGDLILDLEKHKQQLEVERRKLIWNSKVEIESAALRVASLKSQLESSQRLFEQSKSVSGEELEKRRLEYELAVAEKKNLQSAEERQRLEYEFSLEELRQHSLRAPIEGVINKLFLNEGESCQANQPLVQIVDTGKGLFICTMEEPVGRLFKVGDNIDLTVRVGQDTVIKQGTVIFASPVVDSASSLMEIKAEFDNHDGLIRPGVSGWMLLPTPGTVRRDAAPVR
jgi:multidrug efflux system membrane fusion protein